MVAFTDTPEEAIFRADVRAFINEKLPDELKGSSKLGRNVGAEGPEASLAGARDRWTSALRERGWLAAHWPKEYGGGGLSVYEQFIYGYELAHQRVAMMGGVGLSHAGPTIMVAGNEVQRREHLPKILSGEVTWCQGFSEPGAGSDLAGLTTRARRDGDNYIVNGQKIWTSMAHLSDWAILLTRTDPEAPKHRGISFFLMDMKSPGVTVRPVLNLMGHRFHNEVFLEDVVIPAKNLVGEENRGWYVAVQTLDFERSGVTGAVNLRLTLEDIRDVYRDLAPRMPAHRRIRSRIELADRFIETGVAQLISFNIASTQKRGEVVTREASISKLFNSELRQRVANTAINLLGPAGVVLDGPGTVKNGAMPADYATSIGATIGGGTSEIMRNIIANRGLGLPRS